MRHREEDRRKMLKVQEAILGNDENFLDISIGFVRTVYDWGMQYIDGDEDLKKLCVQIVQDIHASPMYDPSIFHRGLESLPTILGIDDSYIRLRAEGLLRNPMLSIWIDDGSHDVLSLAAAQARMVYWKDLRIMVLRPGWMELFESDVSPVAERFGWPGSPRDYLFASQDTFDITLRPPFSVRFNESRDPFKITPLILAVRKAFNIEGERLMLEHLFEEP